MQKVAFKDIGNMNYRAAWDYQESLLKENIDIKSHLRMLSAEASIENEISLPSAQTENEVITPCQLTNATINYQTSTLDGHSVKAIPRPSTKHYLLFVEHPPVYTLGKSGHMENILISEAEMEERGIEFYKTNRGGDITFHGPGQIVGYPILDLEKFYTDIGKYLRNLEEVIILTMEEYGLKGVRSPGETGVWLETGIKGRERKICAMGVRCSRWITMHGFAFNINTDLNYFNHIIPCGIQNKSVTSLQKELSKTVNIEEVKGKLKRNFERVFQVVLVE